MNYVPKRSVALVAALAGVLALGACATGPNEPYLGGAGDPLTGAALSAPWEFGQTARLNGKPQESAAAAFRVEQLADAADNDPRWQFNVPGTLQPQLRMARAQMREALGISPNVSPATAEAALYRALVDLGAGNTAGAVAALAVPGFTLGGAGTLARLGDLPRLRLVDEAANYTAQAFGPTGNGYFGRSGRRNG